MRLAQIEDGVVSNVAEVDPEFIPEFMQEWRTLPDEAGPGWLWDEDTLTYSPPAPPALTVEDYKTAVQAHLDAAAQSRLYTDGNSLATYTASTNPQWAAEAKAFVAWRDVVWAQVYGMWASPPDPVPTPAEVVAGLPVIDWPEEE